MKIVRLLIIFLITIGFLWIGSRFHAVVQNSRADIFDFMYGGRKSIPDFREGANYSQKGKSIINGVPFTYSVEVADGRIGEILDYYKKLYNPPYVRLFTDEQLEKAGVKPGDDAFFVIRICEAIFAKMVPNVLEFKGETIGVLGILDMGDNTKFFIDKHRTEKTVPKVVMAFKQNPYSPKTTIIKYWTDKVFDLNKFIPKGDKDLPGFDLEDIDRHPYSQRLMSMVQADEFASSKAVVYRVDDNLDSVIIYYLADLRGNGWEIPESVIIAAEKSNEKRFIFARKGDRSVYITFGTDRFNYTSVVMIERYE